MLRKNTGTKKKTLGCLRGDNCAEYFQRTPNGSRRGDNTKTENGGKNH